MSTYTQRYPVRLTNENEAKLLILAQEKVKEGKYREVVKARGIVFTELIKKYIDENGNLTRPLQLNYKLDELKLVLLNNVEEDVIRRLRLAKRKNRIPVIVLVNSIIENEVISLIF